MESSTHNETYCEDIKQNFPSEYCVILELLNNRIVEGLFYLSIANCHKLIKALRVNHFKDALEGYDPDNPLICRI